MQELYYFRQGYEGKDFTGNNSDARRIYDLGETFREELLENQPEKMYIESFLDELRINASNGECDEIESFIKEKLNLKNSLNEMAFDIHDTALEKGFWDDTSIPEKLALIHSEVSEVLEADRKDHGKEAVEEELADILIRTLDLCSHLQMDVDKVMKMKTEKNRSRTHKHGNKY